MCYGCREWLHFGAICVKLRFKWGEKNHVVYGADYAKCKKKKGQKKGAKLEERYQVVGF